MIRTLRSSSGLLCKPITQTTSEVSSTGDADKLHISRVLNPAIEVLMAKYRVLVTKITRFEVTVVAVDAKDAQEYAVGGFNSRDKKVHDCVIETSIIASS